MILLNPTQYDGKDLDDSSRELMLKTIEFFERKGKVRLKRDDRERVWYQDFLDFLKEERAFARLLTPAAYGGGDPDVRWDTFRNCEFNEITAFYGLHYWYTWPAPLKADLSKGNVRVAELQELMRTELLKRLPQLDIRPKPPHVTLARFKKNASRDASRKVANLLSQREDPPRAMTDFLDRVHLVKSTLTPESPIYETVKESLLSEHGDRATSFD